MVAWTGEKWQKSILYRDYAEAATCISYLANLLYPEMTYAKDREAKVLKIPEMRRLDKILTEKMFNIKKILSIANRMPLQAN